MHLLSIKMAFYPQKTYLCQSQFFYSKYSIDILFSLLFALFFITLATLVVLITHFLRSASVLKTLILFRYRFLRDARCEA